MMKDYPSKKGTITMFFRFLGKIFLYFFIFPAIVRTWRRYRHAVVSAVCENLSERIDKDVKNLAKSRMNHPAGTKLPE